MTADARETVDWRQAAEDRYAQARAAAEKASAEFYADNDPTAVRDIDWPFPPCPVCDLDLEHDDGWWCDVCCVYWSENGTHPRRDLLLVEDRAVDQSPDIGSFVEPSS